MKEHRFPYQDPSLTPEARVADLLPRMSLEEKFTQMRLLRIDLSFLQQIPMDLSILEENAHRLGSIYCAGYVPEENIRAIQDWAVSHSRWGIPIALHGESIHGVMAENCTCFPQSVGLASTFHTELMEEVATQIGREARANGLSMTYAPNVDLSRDPRWGRVEENYGEDPYLTSQMGVSYVIALQAQGVAACPKHYIAHGSPESGINLAPVHAGEREFYETMAVPFEKVVREGGAMGIMPAYSEWDGVPIHASYDLLTKLLREEWGFDGQVVSDYGAVKMLHTFQRVAEDLRQAGEMALRAGVDVEAPDYAGFGKELEEAVRNGEVPEQLVDQAAGRVLLHKFRLGLFENPYGNVAAQYENRNEQALQLARRAAQESVVLLKNEGLLPLWRSVSSIAVIGPNADNPQLGDYTSPKATARAVTLRTALEERLGKDRVLFARGCTTAGGTDAMLAEAVEAARKAQVAVLVLGDNSNFYGGIGWGDSEKDGTVAVTCGEGFDVSSLDLPARQQELLEAVFATGTPVVLVMESGRPYAIHWAKDHIPAILQAWYPGEQGGYALADLLFGDSNPSGRLPISIPRSVGHLPCFYNHKVSAKGYYRVPGSPEKPGRDYVFADPGALFAFGEGLSYTTFAYCDLCLPQKSRIGETAEVSVTVQNTGDRAGYEVVQLYVTDSYCRITPFVKRLRGFQKIWLEPGEQKRVAFRLGAEDFAFINEQMQQEVEPGEFVIRVGNLQGTLWLERRDTL